MQGSRKQTGRLMVRKKKISIFTGSVGRSAYNSTSLLLFKDLISDNGHIWLRIFLLPGLSSYVN
jgi:hypothetical protein